MAKKNFKGVPDDYATSPYPGWGIPEEAFKFGPGKCFCGVDHSIHEPIEPVLIKSKPLKAFFDPDPKPFSPMPIKQIRIDVRPEIPGYSSQKNGFKKHSFGLSISDHQDITESQLRKLLMDGFMKITDDIIKNMKEQNK